MAKTVRLPQGEPLLDIASYARGKAVPADRLTPAQIEHIRRTVQRVPEVVVKVLSRGGNDARAAAKHLDYIGRYGELDLEDEDGQRMQGRIGKVLMEDWDLDIDSAQDRSRLSGARDRRAPKLVHKLMFSMPPGTPPDRVLGAVRNFAREQFALQHRYAFVLHTDEPHPHVHLVFKAVGEQGIRLNIKKATLRHWRSEFARHLRLLGVAANATERAVRGESRSPKKDGIYRASQRGDSAYMRTQAEAIASEMIEDTLQDIPGRRQLLETRKQVVHGWSRIASALEHGGQGRLANEIRQFVTGMALPRADREWIATVLTQKAECKSHERTALR
jgi:hypothetical protein